MFFDLTAWIMDSIRSHGARSVFVGVLIEQIVVPIPSPLIIMGAGAILIPPEFAAPAALTRILTVIVVPGTLASTIGGWLGYAVGYWGGKPAVDRFSGFLGFNWSDIEDFERRLVNRRTGPMIFLLRAIPVVPLSLISIGLGVLRWPIGSFTGWTLLGSIPRCLLLGWLGWLLADAYMGLASGINRVEGLVSVLIVGVLGAGILYLRRKVRAGR